MADKLFRIGHRFRVGLVVGNRKIDYGFAEHAAHSRFKSFVGDGIFEVIHVTVSGGATAQHLSKTKTRAHAHKIFGDVLGFGGKDVFREPLLQIQIVG